MADCEKQTMLGTSVPSSTHHRPIWPQFRYLATLLSTGLCRVVATECSKLERLLFSVVELSVNVNMHADRALDYLDIVCPVFQASGFKATAFEQE